MNKKGLLPVQCQYSLCGAEFQPIRVWQKYCCPEHRQADWLAKHHSHAPMKLKEIIQRAREIIELCESSVG